jgi:hypothetical protein
MLDGKMLKAERLNLKGAVVQDTDRQDRARVARTAKEENKPPLSDNMAIILSFNLDKIWRVSSTEGEWIASWFPYKSQRSVFR